MKLSQCRRCDLCKKQESGFRRTNVVLGRGSTKYRIMFVGEAPGELEDRLSKPFVGTQPAGQMYDKILKNLRLNRKMVYTTNAVKCRPTQVGDKGPKNRAPSEIEIDTCRPWIVKEIKKVKPILIVTMGNVPLKSILGIEGVTRHAGRLVWCKEFDCYVFPMLHPAAIIYEESRKAKMKSNIIVLRAVLKEIF